MGNWPGVGLGGELQEAAVCFIKAPVPATWAGFGMERGCEVSVRCAACANMPVSPREMGFVERRAVNYRYSEMTSSPRYLYPQETEMMHIPIRSMAAHRL